MILVGIASFLAFSPVRPVVETQAQNRSVKTTDSDEPYAVKIELSPTKGTGPDKNIKETRGKNSSKKPATSKDDKTCRIAIKNNTDQTIDIYVGGRFRHTMGPMDSSYFTNDSTVIYAKAEFDDGSYFYWGPSSFKCGDNAASGSVHFVINP